MRRLFFKDDDGFTTAGAAVALLLVFALMFASVRSVWVGTHSGDIQYVADAGALAADNTIAEFMTLAEVLDAALLSLSLLGITVYAASAVAAFIPGGQEFAAQLVDLGTKILSVRDKAATYANKALNAAQKALPALVAVRAASCIQANADASGMSYHGFALAFPFEGEDVSIADDDTVDEAAEDIKSEEGDIQENAQRMEELQDQMDDAKREGWLADCGSSGMNMQERASTLAGLSSASNPDYSSPDNWSFSVALARAKTYYRARYQQEAGAASSGSAELVGESIARKHFYAYALETVSKGSVGKTSTGAELPSLKSLARNTAQIKQTHLYTDAVYVVSVNSDGVKTLHAWAGCPGYTSESPAGTAAVSAIDTGAVEKCSECKYSATTLGRVPSASTSISNGFEYHYKKLVEAADTYKELAQDAEQVASELSDSRNTVSDAIKKALKSLKATRCEVTPPGRYGCICVVYASTADVPSEQFVSDAGNLPARVAISGASLAADSSTDGANIITELGSNLVSQDSFASGLVKTVFGAWGSALQAYCDGYDGLKGLLRQFCGMIPVVGTDLSEWAEEGFEEAIDAVGYSPPDLNVYKPVLVNTSMVVANDDSAVAEALIDLKIAAQAASDVSVGDIEALFQTLDVDSGVADYLSDDGIELLRIPLSEYGLASQDAVITLPAPSTLLSDYAALAKST